MFSVVAWNSFFLPPPLCHSCVCVCVVFGSLSARPDQRPVRRFFTFDGPFPGISLADTVVYPDQDPPGCLELDAAPILSTFELQRLKNDPLVSLKRIRQGLQR